MPQYRWADLKGGTYSFKVMKDEGVYHQVLKYQLF
jgi:hypothetical protein